MNNVKFVAFQTIVTSEINRFMRIWVQSILPSVITSILYFLIFGAFIGSRIGNINGVSYMQFIAPGLIMMSVITNSYNNVVASFYAIRFQRSVEELLIAPIPNWLILLGFTIGGVLRGIIVGCFVALVALLFTHISIHHLWITLTVVSLTAFLFSLAGFTNALFARKFDDISLVPTFILTPLIYLGGVFYSIHQLPYFWQTVSKLNPIFYVINSFRYGIMGLSDFNNTAALLLISLLVVLLFAINILLLQKGIGVRT